MITRTIDRNFANMRLDRFLRKAFPEESLSVFFGDYLSETFFARVKEAAGAQNLVYLQAERSDFSIGSALCALTEGFFS